MSSKSHLALRNRLFNATGRSGAVVFNYGKDGIISVSGENTGGYSSREIRRYAARMLKKGGRK